MTWQQPNNNRRTLACPHCGRLIRVHGAYGGGNYKRHLKACIAGRPFRGAGGAGGATGERLS